MFTTPAPRECSVCTAPISSDYYMQYGRLCPDCADKAADHRCRQHLQDLLGDYSLDRILRLLSAEVKDYGANAYAKGDESQAAKWWRISTDLYAIYEEVE